MFLYFLIPLFCGAQGTSSFDNISFISRRFMPPANEGICCGVREESIDDGSSAGPYPVSITISEEEEKNNTFCGSKIHIVTADGAATILEITTIFKSNSSTYLHILDIPLELCVEICGGFEHCTPDEPMECDFKFDVSGRKLSEDLAIGHLEESLQRVIELWYEFDPDPTQLKKEVAKLSKENQIAFIEETGRLIGEIMEEAGARFQAENPAPEEAEKDDQENPAPEEAEKDDQENPAPEEEEKDDQENPAPEETENALTGEQEIMYLDEEMLQELDEQMDERTDISEDQKLLVKYLVEGILGGQNMDRELKKLSPDTKRLVEEEMKLLATNEQKPHVRGTRGQN